MAKPPLILQPIRETNPPDSCVPLAEQVTKHLLPHVKIYSNADSLPQLKIYSKQSV